MRCPSSSSSTSLRCRPSTLLALWTGLKKSSVRLQHGWGSFTSCYYLGCASAVWGLEFRKSLPELAAARAKAALVRAYVDGKLQAPGLTPLPVPTLPSQTSRQDIHTLLQRSLQKLTVDAQVLPPLTSFLSLSTKS